MRMIANCIEALLAEKAMTVMCVRGSPHCISVEAKITARRNH